MRQFSRRWPLTLAAALVLVFAIIHFAGQQVEVAADGNVVKNAGFEEGINGLPKDWQLEKKAANKGRVSIAVQPVHGGQASLKLEPNPNNNSDSLLDNPLGVGQGFPAGPFLGKKVYVSAWLGAEGGATAVVGLFGLTAAGGLISAELKQPSGKPGFSFQEDVLVVPNDRRIAYVVLTCIVHGTSGAAYFDDLYVSTDVPASFGNSTSASTALQTAGSAALTAAITVNATRTLRSIPSGLYGTNIEWIWDGDGIWDASRNALNPQVVELARALHPTLIRFPGGTFSDFYHWRDGIGSQESRKETPQMPGAGNSRHTFGTDEALAFADAVGGRLLITVNAGTGTAAEAADWVHYVNRIGLRVEYWEIGNELYVNDGSPQSKASTLPPDKYAQRVVEFARAMRAAGPPIKIGAIGEENYSASAAHAYPDWTGQVLRIAGKEIDFLSVHNAYAPALAMDKGWQLRPVYAAMLAAPVLIRRNLEALAFKIQQNAPGSASRIKIAITEWGPYFQATPDGRFVDHVKTLGSALYVASAFNAFLSSPQTEVANAFKLVDPLFMGWIGKRGDQYLATGPYFATQMYAQHFGSVLVDSSSAGPSYDSQSVGWADAVQGVPYLDVVASRSQDGRKVYVLAVNKNFDQPVQGHITINGFQPSGCTAWTLTGANIDSNTGTEPFRAPGVEWAQQAVDEVNPQFNRGALGEIQIARQPLAGAAAAFTYEFPAHSVVSLEIDGR